MGIEIKAAALPSGKLLEKPPAKPKMARLRLDAGKKQKIPPGDILGALTGEGGIAGAQVGKINSFADSAYAAVSREAAKAALKQLGEGKLKGRSVKVRRMQGQPSNSRRLASRRS